MKKFADYTQAVITRYGLRGQNAVARELNITTASMSQFTTGKALPSEETMIKLAELAGMPKEEALIDLNLWRSKSNPEVQKIWQRLSKMIGCWLIILLGIAFRVNSCFVNTIDSSDCTQKSIRVIYYATNMCLLFGASLNYFHCS